MVQEHSRDLQIFVDYISLVDMLKDEDQIVSWRVREQIEGIQNLLRRCPANWLEYTNRSLNPMAYELAWFALKNPSISLFHRGMDLPNWVAEAATASNFKLILDLCSVFLKKKNSLLLYISIYSLSIYASPNSTLEENSKLKRLRSKRRPLYLMDLMHTRTSLMVYNVFDLLNVMDEQWSIFFISSMVALSCWRTTHHKTTVLIY